MERKCGSTAGVPPPFVGPGSIDCWQFHATRLRFHGQAALWPRGATRMPWRWWTVAFWSPPFCCSLAQQVWFKNRRAKWRRQKRSSSEESENAEKWNKASSKASPEKREEEGKSDLDSDS